MKKIIQALYNEPVLAAGVLLGAATALAAAEVISPWIPVVAVGILTPIQRFFTTPDQPK